ncbi:hypothetical protein BT96DRAFT_959335 [Gymnopus androsaceus JB14]|uniref:Reverse transcriptase domain-containing protein n=1 Tax=Gymnopus androsaceus JB14 TaxID=1447944 RepID=A0A6A4H3X2_9AGAR|nr:hypothetical protein BT96DRAFT_959335 [Gymnopus androsaceus JB14]
MIRESDLKGYRIPGAKERLITNLFADDTSAFLNATDEFEDLQNILKKWWKTNIIPIGTKAFREQVVQSRITDCDKSPLPGNLHISQEGEAVRILGAWFGNDISAEQVWAPVLEMTDSSLSRWAKNGPTMDGRRAIIQMVIGGMTQYLTMVQGMPASIEKRLTKRINRYLWKEKERNPKHPLGNANMVP